MQEHFRQPPLAFSPSPYGKSTEVNYASIPVVSNTETLLEPEILEEISKVEGAVQALTVTQDNGTQIPATSSKVCTKNQAPVPLLPPKPLLLLFSPGKGTRAST